MNNQLKTIAELPQEIIKAINAVLTFSSECYFSGDEISYLKNKTNHCPFMRGTLLSDELMLKYGLIQGDYSKQFINDEIEAFKNTLVESDYSAKAYQEAINNELYRIKSQICRHAVVLSQSNNALNVILLCEQYEPITIKKVKLIADEDFSKAEVIKKRGETYFHVEGCLWVNKSLKEKYFGHLYVLQTNSDFRKIAYFTTDQLRQFQSLKNLIKHTLMEKHLSFMLTINQAYSFSESEIRYYGEMTQEELQHEFNCTQIAYENADENCYIDHCHTLDLLQHVAFSKNYKII